MQEINSDDLIKYLEYNKHIDIIKEKYYKYYDLKVVFGFSTEAINKNGFIHLNINNGSFIDNPYRIYNDRYLILEHSDIISFLRDSKINFIFS